MDKKLSIITLVVVIISTILTGFNTVTLLKNGKPSSEQNLETSKPKDLEYVPLTDTITANVAKDGPASHIIRVAVTLGVDSKEFKAFSETLSQKEVVIKDVIIQVLRGKTYEMLSTPNAQQIIGEEISKQVNAKLNTQAIQSVLFSEFFIQ